MYTYKRSLKYTDLDAVYSQTSGPGGLKLTEYIADHMGVTNGARLLDVGANRGWQSCFLAKDYGLSVVAIDPWDDRMDNRPMTEHIADNARSWGVSNGVLPIKCGVPDTPFANSSFDFVYSTTALEMLRVIMGEDGYINCLRDIGRVLRPGGVFGLGEPMHYDVAIPEDLEPYVSQEEYPWKDCFGTLDATVDAVKSAGFEIVRAEYPDDSKLWWDEYAAHDPFCKADPDEDPKTLAVDDGRWVAFGVVIARKR